MSGSLKGLVWSLTTVIALVTYVHLGSGSPGRIVSVAVLGYCIGLAGQRLWKKDEE